MMHDVATPFYGDLKVIIDHLQTLVGSQFSCAVVPCWHGQKLAATDNLLRVISDCDEVLQHDFTHFRDDKPGIISKFTGRSDEFRGMGVSEIQDRINNGRTLLRLLTGRDIHGLLPPAWQLPVPATTLKEISYVVRFTQLQTCHDAVNFRKLATWSFDWGVIKQAAWAGDFLGTVRWKLCPHSIPCIVIHPIDLKRGWWPRITNLIQKFLDLGYHSTVPQKVFAVNLR
jgi:hypothetical protein